MLLWGSIVIFSIFVLSLFPCFHYSKKERHHSEWLIILPFVIFAFGVWSLYFQGISIIELRIALALSVLSFLVGVACVFFCKDIKRTMAKLNAEASLERLPPK